MTIYFPQLVNTVSFELTQCDVFLESLLIT